MARDAAGSRGEDGHAGKRDGHAEGLAPGELFEAEKYGEDEGVDGPHAEDDGRVGYAGVTQADREAHLIQRHTKEPEIRECEKIVRGALLFMGEEVGAEGGEARGNVVEKQHESSGGDYAEGSEREGLQVAESVFDGEVVGAPDEHDEGDGEVQDGVGGAMAVGGSYAHGSGWVVEYIFPIIRRGRVTSDW